MKTIRLFTMFAALLLGSALYAKNDTTAVCVKLTAANGKVDRVRLMQNAAFHATTKDADEGSKIMNEVPNVNIYVAAPYGQMSSFKTNNIVGTKLTIQTNSQTNYTLSFNELMGDTLYLKDNEMEAIVPVTATQEYGFTAEAKDTIADRFVFVDAPVGGEYLICYRNGYLQISNYPTDKNTNHIVVRDEDNNVVKDKNGKDLDVEPQAIYQEIDLRHLTSGHYTIEANGETLTIGVKQGIDI